MQNIEPSESWGLGSAGFAPSPSRAAGDPRTAATSSGSLASSTLAPRVASPSRSSRSRPPFPPARKCSPGLRPGSPTISRSRPTRARAAPRPNRPPMHACNPTRQDTPCATGLRGDQLATNSRLWRQCHDNDHDDHATRRSDLLDGRERVCAGADAEQPGGGSHAAHQPNPLRLSSRNHTSSGTPSRSGPNERRR